MAVQLEKTLRDLLRSLDIDFSRLRTTYWQLKKNLNLHFLEDLNEIYWREYTVNDLRYFYRDNLEWVLESVGEIIEESDNAKIAITADHGEAFGEKGEFFHLYRTRNPVVRLVPFWQNKT